EIADKKIRVVGDIEKLVDAPILVYGKENKTQAVKTMLTHTFSNYAHHKKIAVLSFDEPEAVETFLKEATVLLENAGLKYETVNISQSSSILYSKKISEIIEEKSKNNEFIILPIPKIKNNYEGIVELKYADGVILVVKLSKSEKKELIKTLSFLEEEQAELQGIIVF
ncbi:MAG: hypothetical protein ACK4MM_05260, partial [Fervidobacterium sp.]